MAEILSVLKPFAEEAGVKDTLTTEGYVFGEHSSVDHPYTNLEVGQLRRARDLYIKLGGVL
jgi:hypothetical protein